MKRDEVIACSGEYHCVACMQAFDSIQAVIEHVHIEHLHDME